MTVEEAKNELKEMWVEFDYTLHDKSANAIDVAIKALEKQIPKKPLASIVEYRYGIFKKGTTVLRLCPSCEEWVLYTHHKAFCGNCGQALDWRVK